jgi:protocatechuate 3,4-dioxygenase, alpha subunit
MEQESITQYVSQITPSQTVGPFFAYSLTAEQYGYNYNSIMNGSLVNDEIEGERIFITGKIFDGNGAVIPDAIIELWQPQLYEQYQATTTHHKPAGFGRLGTGTDPESRFSFTTIKPTASNGNAPHINVILMMRGSLRHLYTRLYFSDEDSLNQQDILLNQAPQDRRATLIAEQSVKNGQSHYEFNIRMQGQGETLFFDI